MSAHVLSLKSVLAFCGVCGVLYASSAAAQQVASKPIQLNTSPLVGELREQVYAKPARVPDITPQQVRSGGEDQQVQSAVTGRVDSLAADLVALQNRVETLSANFSAVQREGEGKASEYYAAVATINTQLQAGTTPGNPRLLNRLGQADAVLEDLSGSVLALNRLSGEGAGVAAETSYLLEATRAAYNLSGAVEEDHVRLSELEDRINTVLVIVDRIIDNVNDAVTRTTTYLSSERSNLRTLSLAVANGDLYGKSLSNRPFSSPVVARYQEASIGGGSAPAPSQGFAPAPEPLQQGGGFSDSPDLSAFAPGQPPAPAPQPLIGSRQLVKIKFDRSDVDYEEPVYLAINEALQRYPDARFDLVAIYPAGGNEAEAAIESTKARRNAEKVLRTLTQLGLPLERIDLSQKASADGVSSNEVQIFIRGAQS